MEPAAACTDFRLGDWLVEPSLNRVSRGAVVEHVRPRLVELLVFLARHAGQAVTKDQILQAVWRQRFVAESVLSRSVADLRQLLGDDRERPTFIETIPKRGYRLVGAVSWAIPAAAALSTPSIVVLPFVDMAPGCEQEYFCDGLAEELTNSLAQLPGCRVVARTSAFAFKGRALDVREIGRQLGVSTVVEGGVQRDGDRLRITVQVIEAATGCHVWSHRFDCSTGDIFAVEDEMVQGVVAALKVRMGRHLSLVQGRTADAGAHDLYLRGRSYAARRNADALEEAARHFGRAIELLRLCGGTGAPLVAHSRLRRARGPGPDAERRPGPRAVARHEPRLPVPARSPRPAARRTNRSMTL